MRGPVIFLMAVVLASCGFTPMYSSRGVSTSDTVVAALSQVDVRPIARTAPAWSCVSNWTKNCIPAACATPATIFRSGWRRAPKSWACARTPLRPRANLILTANFILWDGTARLLRDRVRSTVSYNILDDQYATIASERDAENRALKQISDEIRGPASRIL